MQVRIAHQFGHEGLTHRCVKGGGAAEQEGENVDMPELDEAGNGQDAERQREQPHSRLRRNQELALVEAVGGIARPRQQEKLRPELQCHDQPDSGCIVASELSENQPVLGRPLYPGAYVGDEGAADPDPIVETSQGTEDARDGRLHGCFGWLPPLKRPNCRAAGSAIAEDEFAMLGSLSAAGYLA